MKKKLLYFPILFLGMVLFSSCEYGISFNSNVLQISDVEFMDKIEITDDKRCIYNDTRPSVVFIYSDLVEHCRRQSKIFNQTAELYGDKIHFYAIEDKQAENILALFGDSGKRPMYLFVNIKSAQKVVVDNITLNEMQNYIFRAFGVRPTQKI